MIKKIFQLIGASVLLMLSMIFAEEKNLTSATGPLKFEMTSIDGESVKLTDYEGKVILLVNVASKCGLTPQYEGLQKIYDKYKDDGFVILGFPANNFLGQEPGTNDEIETFCSINYGVTFPLFAKISVKGKDQHPLYQYLTDKNAHEFGGKIKWNFAKFIIGKDGHIKARFSPKTIPEHAMVISAIERELKK
jgi:glutathione peroxidase